MNKPLVSIIIPFFQNKEWLQQALESAQQQTYINVEIIVVDDGSIENITGILQKNKNIIYKKISNSGPGKARNTGISMSKGDYIAFLDSDDIWHPEKLEKQINFMVEHDFVWSHTAYELFGENIDNKIVSLQKDVGMVFPRNIYSSKMATPCIVIKSDIIKKNNFFFAEDMRTGQDGFMWLQLSMKYSVGYLDKVLTSVRIRGTNSAQNSYSQVRSRAQLFQKIKDTYPEIVKKNINVFARYAFYRCKVIYQFTTRIFKKNRVGTFVDFFIKVLYFPSWLIFKLSYLNEVKR